MALGVFAIAYGFYTLYVRKNSPEKLTKLEIMKQRYGAEKGARIHFVGYTLMPIALGLIFIVAGYLRK